MTEHQMSLEERRSIIPSWVYDRRLDERVLRWNAFNESDRWDQRGREYKEIRHGDVLLFDNNEVIFYDVGRRDEIEERCTELVKKHRLAAIYPRESLLFIRTKEDFK